MAEALHTSAARWPYGIIAALCLLPWGVSAAPQAPTPPISQQIKQPDDSERRIAADQAEQLRRAQERSDEQRRAQAEAERRREAEQREEEFLIQSRGAQPSNPPQPQNAFQAPGVPSGPGAKMIPQQAPGTPASALEPPPRRYSFMRQAGLVLMIGASVGALFVLGRIVQQSLAR